MARYRFAEAIVSAASGAAFLLLVRCGGDAFRGGAGGEGGSVDSAESATATSGPSVTAGPVGSGGGSASVGSTGGSTTGMCAIQNGGFESGSLTPGWEGAGSSPQYASVSIAAVHTGMYSVELNDTGVGVPGIQQKVPVTVDLLGKQLRATA